MIQRTLAAAAALALAAAAPAHSQRPAARADAAMRTRLDSVVPALVRGAELPGLSAAVVRDGAVYWSGAYGMRDAESRAPVDANTVFDAASLTKPVVGYAVLRLVDRGVVSLDRPLAEIVPNPRMAHDERYRLITPRMVLSHTTGLPNWGSDDRVDMIGDPGQKFGYSGEGFVYLAQAVEKLTGRSITDVVRDEVLVPFGMTRTSLVWNDSLEADGARSHDVWGKARPVNRRDKPNAAASLRTTALDYGRFLAAAMEGRGLQPKTHAQMLSAFTQITGPRAGERLFWGLGWGLVQRADGGQLMWHWGDNGDAKAFVAADPARRTGVVYFANAQQGLAVARSLVSMVVPGIDDAIRWLDYDQSDAPDWRTRRVIARAGVDSGAAAALARWREARASSRAAARLAVAASRMMSDQGAAEPARAVLADAAASYADSAFVQAALGDAALEAADYDAAVAAYRVALARAPRDSSVRASLAWAEEGARALAEAPTIPEVTLARYVGEYGPRRITLESGRLFYQRGEGRKRALAPLGADTFAPEGLGNFRVRFVLPPEGPAEKILGIYLDGTRDENPRTK
ncbi:MAG: serine hydrolase domain-containing protein [Gemmatimonadaceae bacterium]